MPKKEYYYHATPKKNGASIAENGLKPRSVGGEATSYLCMSGTESGAITLGSQASDIIFRADRSELESENWRKVGAGKDEWRTSDQDGIPNTKLEYRRNLGTNSQKTWRSASDYPKGL